MRNPEFIKIRDQKLVETFHQLYDVKRIRMDDVLTRMSMKMFFLDADYIYKRIFYVNENLAYYEQLKRKRKAAEERAKK